MRMVVKQLRANYYTESRSKHAIWADCKSGLEEKM